MALTKVPSCSQLLVLGQGNSPRLPQLVSTGTKPRPVSHVQLRCQGSEFLRCFPAGYMEEGSPGRSLSVAWDRASAAELGGQEMPMTTGPGGP